MIATAIDTDEKLIEGLILSAGYTRPNPYDDNDIGGHSLLDEDEEQEGLEFAVPELDEALGVYWSTWARYERDDAGVGSARSHQLLLEEHVRQYGIRLPVMKIGERTSYAACGSSSTVTLSPSVSNL